MEKKCPCYVEGKNTEKRMDMSKALFITGTGTDIGKTYVTGLIVKKLAEEGKSAAYYKAAMSGSLRYGRNQKILQGLPPYLRCK